MLFDKQSLFDCIIPKKKKYSMKHSVFSHIIIINIKYLAAVFDINLPKNT